MQEKYPKCILVKSDTTKKTNKNLLCTIGLWLVLLEVLGFSGRLSAGNSDITGPTIICVDETATYFTSLPNVITYEWYASGPASYAAIDSSQFRVSWSAPGSYTVTLQVMTSSGPATYLRQVTVNPMEKPLIHASFDSDCGTVSAAGEYTPNECLVACAGSTVSYWVETEPNDMVTWDLPAGVNVVNLGDSIVVDWASPGFYTLSVTVAPRYGCAGTTTTCVEIIAPPTAAMQTSPAPVNGVITLCLNQTLHAFSNSTPGQGSPLTQWNWQLGDGFVGQGESVSHAYNTPGTYTLIHQVGNDCHCVDADTLTVVVNTSPAVDIVCTGIVCPGDTVIYHTTTLCSSYTWTVQGGIYSTAINQDNVLDSIAVVWGSPSNGVGSITLQTTSCGGSCQVPVTEFIPVLVDNIPIQGSDTACIGSTYTYQLPALPGTTIAWQLAPGSSGNIVGPSTGQQVEVYWNGAGTQTIQATYTNTLLGCEGTSTFNVVVQPPFVLHADERYCPGGAAVFSVTPASGSFKWVITNQDGTTVFTENNGSSTVTIPTWIHGSGSFRIRAIDLSGSYCTAWEEEDFTVLSAPPKLTAIEGDAFICPGELGIYSAIPSSNQYYLTWQITGGTPTTATGNTVAVRWNSTGPWKVGVRQVQRLSPECEGDSLQLIVNQWPQVLPAILGADSACVNSTAAYTTQVAGGSKYEWTITPTASGSVAEGQGERDIIMQWNNAPGPATIQLKVTVCGISQTNTRQIFLKDQTDVSILGADSVCVNTSIAFSASATGQRYLWDFGDGTTLNTTSMQASHTYGTPGTYPITLAVVQPDGCTDTARTATTLQVLPAPVATISTPDDTVSCTAINATIYVAIQQNNGAGCLYQWYKDGAAIIGQTGTSLTVTAPGTYRCAVTDAITACSAFTNRITFTVVNCSGGCTIAGSADFTYSSDDSCGSVAVTAQLSAGGRLLDWEVVDPSGARPTFTTPSFSYRFNSAGYHRVKMRARFPEQGGGVQDSCDTLVVKPIVIPVYADFFVSYSCDTGQSYTATFLDRSSYVDNNTITTSKWYLNGVEQSAFANQATFDLPLTGGQSYSVSLWVKSTTTGAECTTTRSITVPQKPQAAFSAPDNSCIKVPTVFINQSTGTVIQSLWDFGDLATLIKHHGVREYYTSGPIFPSLIILDSYGCSDTASGEIIIHDNSWEGDILAAPATTVCFSEGASLYYQPSFLGDTSSFDYLWLHNLDTFASTTVTASGYYHLYAYDAYGCREKFTSPGMVFQRPPQPVIAGESGYCANEPIQLTVNAGSSYQYQWLLNQQPLQAPLGQSPSLSTLHAPGTYSYSAIITDPALGCTDTSAPFNVTVYGSPGVPSVTSSVVPSCGPALQWLSAQAAASVYYQWNTGQTGTPVPVMQPAQYAVNAYNQYGCYTTGYHAVGNTPDMSSLLTGCYAFCDTLFPLGIPGLPESVTTYAWYRDGNVIQSGAGSMPALQLTGPGAYRLIAALNGCVDTSDFLYIEAQACADSAQLLCDRLSVTLQTIQCAGSFAPDSNVYAVNLTFFYDGGSDAQPYDIIQTTSSEVEPILSGQPIIGGGYTTIPYLFLDRTPLNEEACIEIVLVGGITGTDTCILQLCIPLPECDTTGQCGCCLLDLSLDTQLCIGQLNGSQQYTWSLAVGNPTGRTYGLHVVSPQGILSNVSGGRVVAPLESTTLQGVFTPDTSLPVYCIDVYAVDSTSGLLMHCTVCDTLPVCQPATACALDEVQVQVKTAAVTDSGAAVVYVDISFSGNPGGNLYITSTQAEVLSYDPSQVSAGFGSVHGYLVTYQTDSVCIDVVIVDTLNGEYCRATICVAIPPCERPVADCSDYFTPALDLVVCDSITPQGDTIMSLYWRVSVDTTIVGSWDVVVQSNNGSVSTTASVPLTAAYPYISGYGFGVATANKNYCLDILLMNQATRELCRLQVCANLPCSN